MNRLGSGLAGAFAVVAALAAACATGATEPEGDEAALDAGPAGDGNLIPTDPLDAEEPEPIYPEDRDAGADSATKDSGPKPTSCSAGIVINEVQAGSASDSAHEFVELYNCGGQSVSLGGWFLVYQSGTGGTGMEYEIPGGVSLAPGKFALFGTSKVSGTKAGTFLGGFSADKGQIGLVDDSDKIVDGVAWGTVTGGQFKERNAAATPGTASIGRRPDGRDTDDNRSDFEKLPTASPGRAN